MADRGDNRAQSGMGRQHLKALRAAAPDAIWCSQPPSASHRLSRGRRRGSGAVDASLEPIRHRTADNPQRLIDPTFVQQVHPEIEWRFQGDWLCPMPFEGLARRGIDAPVLNIVRVWLQSTGIVGKRSLSVVRTRLDGEAAVGPRVMWEALTRRLAEQKWERFVAETIGLVLIDRGADLQERAQLQQAASIGKIGAFSQRLSASRRFWPCCVLQQPDRQKSCDELFGCLRRCRSFLSPPTMRKPTGPRRPQSDDGPPLDSFGGVDHVQSASVGRSRDSNVLAIPAKEVAWHEFGFPTALKRNCTDYG